MSLQYKSTEIQTFIMYDFIYNYHLKSLFYINKPDNISQTLNLACFCLLLAQHCHWECVLLDSTPKGSWEVRPRHWRHQWEVGWAGCSEDPSAVGTTRAGYTPARNDGN